MQLENGGLQMLCLQIMLPVHKAVIAGPAGPSSARPLFWPTVLSTVSLLLASANFTLCLPFIDVLSITRVARVKTLKNYMTPA